MRPDNARGSGPAHPDDTVEVTSPDSRHTIRATPGGGPEPGSLAQVKLGDRGPIELLDTLGQGGTARVWRGHQRSLRRDVAVKMPLTGGEARTRGFVREALITGWLSHPNIAPVHELGVDDQGRPVLVMKLIEGQSWEAALDSRDRAEVGGAADLERQLRVLIQVCHAIELAHLRGVLHRDLKPANIMLGAFGEVLVVDWGLAVAIGDEAALRTQRAAEATELAGTPAYMPPEMAAARADALGPATDTYLLGAILHEIVTGRAPHRGQSISETIEAAIRADPPELPATVPDELARILRRAIAREPIDRYRTASALRDALEGFVGHHHAAHLCDEGERHLAIARGDVGARGHDAFVAARFAFMQALAAWPDAPPARTGLQATLEGMAERHLAAGDADAALELIDALADPRPTLRDRAIAMRAGKADAARELTALRDVAREHDLDVGRRTRSLIFLLTAILWGGSAFGTGVMVELGELRLNHEQQLPFMLVMSLAIYGLLWLKRRALLANQVNRRFLVGAAIVVTTDVVNALVGRHLGIPIASSLVLELLFTLLVLVCFAVFVETRLLWAPISFAAFVPLAVADPARVMIYLGLAILASFSTLAWLSHTAPRR